MESNITAMQAQRIADLELRVQKLEQHIINVVRALRAHGEDLQINLGTTTGSLK